MRRNQVWQLLSLFGVLSGIVINLSIHFGQPFIAGLIDGMFWPVASLLS